MDDLNRALNAEVSKLIKWEAETAVDESELEAQLKTAEEEESNQEVSKLQGIQEREKQRSLLRQTKHAR